MSLLLESEAQFASRAKEIGLANDVVEELKNAGVATLSHLAFAVGQPGQALVPAEVDRFLTNVLGRAPLISESTAIRRLAFEAQTLLIASLRQIVEQRDDGTPKRIGTAERESRMNAIKAELGGLTIAEENEPSHALLERACQVHESNNLKYIEPAVCTSRAQEVQGGSKSKELSFEGGSLVIKDKDDKLVAPTSSELQFLHAMTRRGIAFKFAKLMTYQQHNEWTTFLLQAMQREAPPGYAKPSLRQIMLCDKAAFTRLASTVSQVRALADGSFPLGVALLKLKQDPMITLYLAPLARTVANPGAPSRDGAYGAQRPQRSQTSGGKSKGKGKKGKTPPLLVQLKGKWRRTSSGEPLCFAYNIGGCDQALDGQKCPKGWHLCAEPRCLMDHPLPKHPKAAGKTS